MFYKFKVSYEFFDILDNSLRLIWKVTQQTVILCTMTWICQVQWILKMTHLMNVISSHSLKANKFGHIGLQNMSHTVISKIITTFLSESSLNQALDFMIIRHTSAKTTPTHMQHRTTTISKRLWSLVQRHRNRRWLRNNWRLAGGTARPRPWRVLKNARAGVRQSCFWFVLWVGHFDTSLLHYFCIWLCSYFTNCTETG